MINQDDKGDLKWRNFADYDLGRTYKYKVKSLSTTPFSNFQSLGIARMAS